MERASQREGGDLRETARVDAAAIDALAAEFLARAEAGEAPELAPYLERLPGAEQRAELAALVEAAQTASRHLPTPLATGARLCGRYRVLDAIGAGGMGRVFSAWDERLCRRVAIKVLSALDAHDVERREMFLRESRLLAALQHPGIVAVHEAGQDGELSYIVMDLVDGRSLADVLERARTLLGQESSAERPLPRGGELLGRAIGKPIPSGRQDLIDPRSWNRTAARIVLELARILEAAHDARVVHRDLKPQNVMLLGGANPVVLDFGLAGSIELSEGAVTRGLYGSVAYLAPEQVATHQVGNDPRTDVYQLGLVLYELLTLRRAFPGSEIGEVMQRIREGVYKAPRLHNPELARDLESICRMALEPEPHSRYPSARALREDLERFLEGREPPLAARAWRVRALWRRLRWKLRRHPYVTTAVGMLCVGLLSWLVTLREPRYTLNAFRFTPQARLELIGDGEGVAREDLLGVKVEGDASAYVSAFATQGSGSSRVLRPVRPRLASELEGPAESEDGFVRRIPAGRSSLVCAQVGEGDHEGLIVLVSAEPRPEFEYLAEQLEKLSRDELAGVPYDVARDMLAALLAGGTRGTSPELAEVPAERLAALRAQLEAPSRGLSADWTFPGVRTLALECPVEGGAR